jgi:hypothetical protein
MYVYSFTNMFVESFSVIVFLKSIPVCEEGRKLKNKPSFFGGEVQDEIQNKINMDKVRFFIKLKAILYFIIRI